MRPLGHSAVVHSYSLVQARIVITSTAEDVSTFLRQLAARKEGKVQDRLRLAAAEAAEEGYDGEVMFANLGNLKDMFENLKAAEIGLIETALSASRSPS
jgi:hypothetical protein